MKKVLIAALIASLPGVASADARSEEIKLLKAQLKLLQQKVEALEQKGTAAMASANAADSDDDNAPAHITKAELAQLKQAQLKVDSLQQAATEGPLAGLSVTGYLDPTYIYNRNANTSSFQFVNHNNNYTYDTSTLGDVYLDIKKTFGVGPTAPSAEITIMPNRGNGNTLLANENGGIGHNILNTAQISVPVSDTTTIVGGLMNSFGGYDVQQSNQTLGLTHGLLYDFSDPGSYVGAGFNWSHDVWAWKFLVGNEQYRTRGAQAPSGTTFKSNKTPTVTARVDYTKSSALDLGWSLNLGKQTLPVGGACASGTYGYQCNTASPYSRYFFTEADATYTLADVQYNAEVDYGNQKNAAWNGGDASWYGFSLQAHHKWTAGLGRMGATVRYDYLNDKRNGGGGGGIVLGATGNDGNNGWGIDQGCLANSAVGGLDCRGTVRQALAADLLFYPTEQLILKLEYRYDWANNNVFRKSDGTFSKNNNILGAQMVYSF